MFSYKKQAMSVFFAGTASLPQWIGDERIHSAHRGSPSWQPVRLASPRLVLAWKVIVPKILLGFGSRSRNTEFCGFILKLFQNLGAFVEVALVILVFVELFGYFHIPEE